MSLILLLLAAQTTTCTTNLGVTTCNTTPSAPSSDPWQIFREGQAEQSRDIGERNRQMAASEEAAKERRARAYAQVGELIAAGKCEDAKRLARFYNKPDIIKDTARACP